MDFGFTEEQDVFRSEVREWLVANAPTSTFEPYYTDRGREQLRAWERQLYEAGYAAPGWPVEYGGMGLDLWGQLIYDEEYTRLNLPERLNKMGLLHGGPTVMTHGTEEQKRAWLPGILDNSQIWCQGFSEPEAGSDLASLRTSCRIEGDVLVINGQKTWTSYGVIATRMFALVRTDPAATKHRGISFVVLDLDLPGVEVRPLRQLHGHAGFAEVFFTDVRVPLANVVGPLHDGWRIAQTSLRLERGTGRGVHTRLGLALHEVIEEARLGSDAARVERIGSLRAWTFAYEQATYALSDTIARGGDDSADSSILKLRLSELQTAIREEQLDTLGDLAERIPLASPEAALPTALREYWHSRAGEIFAGTTEIQKNIISEVGLGLPREPRQ
jgi:alkylation response protein AidB-like acyl-CoA dehydrogenase